MTRVKIATFDAVGGPAALVRAADGYVAGPTDEGTYRVARCGKHSSPSYPVWSKIRWGSELKEEKGTVLVKHDGRWQPIASLSPTLDKAAIAQRNLELYGKHELPTKWVFNDFGHMTCYFYKDKNNNAKLDKDLGERVHTEYFHTTPDDEADDAAGKPFTLGESHGCIHLRPKDIDEMINKGYFKAGNTVVVHKYKAKIPRWDSDTGGTAPYEIHFFPGARQVVVVGRRPAPSR